MGALVRRSGLLRRLLSARLLVLVVSVLCLWRRCQAVRVGVLLRRGHEDVWREYESAVANFNSSGDANRLGFGISTRRATIDDNLFITARELCKQLNAGVTTVLLPSTGLSEDAVHSLFASTNVPRITTTIQQRCAGRDVPVAEEDASNVTGTLQPEELFRNNSEADEDIMTLGVSMMPHLASAVLDLADAWGFKSLVFIYDSDHALVTLQQLMESERTLVLQARRVSGSSEAHSLLSSLEKSDMHGRRLVVLDCAYDLAKDIVIRHVRDIFMGRRNYHYVFVNPVVGERYLEGVSEFAAINITAFRFQNKEDASGTYNYNYKTTAEEAALVDAAQLILATYKTLKEDPPPKNADLFEDRVRPKKAGRASCGRVSYLTEEQGRVIDSYLKKVTFDGKTGKVAFDAMGCRVNFTVDVIQVNGKNQWLKTGTWSKDSGFVRLGSGNDSTSKDDKNYVYKVSAILEEPYLMLKSPGSDDVPDDQRFEGFCKDLIDAISRCAGMKYKLRLVQDGRYGSSSIDGWNGMVGEVLYGEADIALGGLTITSARKNVVDFTHPFMTTGVAALIKKPSTLQKGVGVHTFLAPFDVHVWIGLGSALGVVLLFLFLFGVSVMKNDHCCYQPPEEQNPKEAVLKTVCESLEAATPPLPSGSFLARSISGRIVSSFWWMFVVVVFSTYTTKMTSFLVLKDTAHADIDTLEELSVQRHVKFGTLDSGSIHEYFGDSKDMINRRISETMRGSHDVLVTTRMEGVERVRTSEGKYVFFTETPFAEYVNNRRPCDTKIIVENFNTQFFGLAVQQGSPLREKLNEAIAVLSESGELDEIKKKWWTSQCDSPPQDEPMRLELFLHIIFYLACLVAGGIVIAFLEFIVRGCNKCRYLRAQRSSSAPKLMLESEAPLKTIT